MRGLILGVAAGLVGALAAAAQAAPYHAPRTWFGAPDLQGAWTNNALTRLERPPGVASLVVSGPEAAALQARLTKGLRERPGDVVGQGESEWPEGAELARIDGRIRTSWIIDPADGRLPYTPAARKARGAAGGGLDDPEDLSPSDRCLGASWGAAGPPMLNPPYAPGYRIVQTADEVVILTEINHEVRHIRLNAAHGAIRQWGGDSVGRWEGDTLVVETVKFHPQESYRAPVLLMSPHARVIERFTRIAPREIRYAFEVDDPATFTSAWRGETPLHASTAPMFEYACHEGNYSLPGMLAGARKAERDAAGR